MPAAARGDPAEGRVDEALRVTVLPQAGGDAAVAAADLAAGSGADVLAVEEHHLSVARYRALGSVADGLRLADLGTAIEQERIVKDDEEITCLGSPRRSPTRPSGSCWSRSSSAAPNGTSRWSWSAASSTTAPTARPSPPPSPPARTPAAAATGPRTGALEEGDFLSVCLGANYRGYRCEIGRTFVIGSAPADWQIELYDLVFTAQRSRPGGARTRRRLPRRGPRSPADPGRGRVRGGAGALPRARGGAGNRGGPAALPRPPWVNWTLACRSPSNQGSTSRDGAGSDR